MKKLRVPKVLVVVTVAAVSVAAAGCPAKVCKPGDPSCSQGGSGTSSSQSTAVGA